MGDGLVESTAVTQVTRNRRGVSRFGVGPSERARVTQIQNLRLLAPDIQEALLFLPRTEACPAR
jgi:hypothetical protein